MGLCCATFFLLLALAGCARSGERVTYTAFSGVTEADCAEIIAKLQAEHQLDYDTVLFISESMPSEYLVETTEQMFLLQRDQTGSLKVIRQASFIVIDTIGPLSEASEPNSNPDEPKPETRSYVKPTRKGPIEYAVYDDLSPQECDELIGLLSEGSGLANDHIESMRRLDANRYEINTYQSVITVERQPNGELSNLFGPYGMPRVDLPVFNESGQPVHPEFGVGRMFTYQPKDTP